MVGEFSCFIMYVYYSHGMEVVASQGLASGGRIRKCFLTVGMVVLWVVAEVAISTWQENVIMVMFSHGIIYLGSGWENIIYNII